MTEQRVPQSEIDDANSDIVEVIGRYIQIKKGGKNWSASCPFHHERTSSFTIEPARGFFYCFGCGESGDAVKFVSMHLGVSFREAVKTINGRLSLNGDICTPAQPRPRKAICTLPCHAEDPERSAQLLALCERYQQHPYLMRNNTAPHDHCLSLKGALIVPIINADGLEVNVAAITLDGIKYAAGNPSYGSTAILEPVDRNATPGKTILCVEYAHAWRIWWLHSGQCRVLCAMDPGNFRWMLANCRERFTHVGCDPDESDEFVEMGFDVIGMPVAPYRRRLVDTAP